MSTFCSGYERLVQGLDLSPHFVFGERNLFVECGKSRRNNVYRGGIVHGNLREKTPTNRATHVVGCTCIDRPPPPRSLEIERNPFLSAIAHWKDVCIVDPSVIDTRSPSRHITPHITCETSKPTVGSTITVFALPTISLGVHFASLVKA